MSHDQRDTTRSLAGIRDEIAEQLRARHSEIAQAIYAYIQEAVSNSVGGWDPAYQAGVLAAVTALLGCCSEAIEHGPGWLEPTPTEAAAQARSAARAGVPAMPLASCGCGAAQTRCLRDALSPPRGMAAVEHEYNQECQRAARSLEGSRAEIVQKLLAGALVDPAELRKLGYELDAWHLGVSATGGEAAAVLRSLAAELGRELLVVACCGKTVWAWLGGERRLAFADVARVFSAQEHADVSLAVGEPARGLQGWRVTHREAEAAQLVARCRPRPLTRYLDVAPEANALQDQALADSLIETHLSPLDDLGIGGQAARRTLRALFDTEHNVSSAAHKLNVDRSTVHRRRNEIERRLGCRLHEHQVDIEIALRVEDLLKRRDSAQASDAAS
jgi:hypothetical protein